MTRLSLIRTFAAASAIAVLGAACTGDGGIARATSGDRADADASGLTWRSCGPDPELNFAGVECATIEVPLDHDDPDGKQVEMELGRLGTPQVPGPSMGGAGEKIGVLLTNPGGPGGSGIDSLPGLAFALPQDVIDSFQIVSWDPRGVARSSPVRCLSDEQKDAEIEGDLSPDTAAELDESLAEYDEFREACEANNPELITHMSTTDVALDMEAIRLALGDEKLNYLGFSYGTAIGATYATLFPDKIRAMVLDGAVSSEAHEEEDVVEQAEGFQRAFDNFLAACEDETKCALHPNPGDQVDSLRERLDTEPIETSTQSGPRKLTMDLFDIGLATALYDSASWGMLARAINNIDDGGAELMLAFSDTQVGRQPDGTWDNSSDAQWMVSCADDTERPSRSEALEDLDNLKGELSEESPLFSDAMSTDSLVCLDWPLAANPVPEYSSPGAPPIMVVGTLGDPATPYEWSEQMAAALESAFLVTYEGEGHTATTRGGECITNALSDYLINSRVQDGLSCPEVSEADDEAPDPFASVEEILFDQITAQGIPDSVARCIAEGMLEYYGESRLELSILQPDVEEQSDVVAGLSMQCMDGG